MKQYNSRGMEDDHGPWCDASDVAELEAENSRLTEIERLKQSSKIMSAEEVTEPGDYIFRLFPDDPWRFCIFDVRHKMFTDESGDMFIDCNPFGQFIGPLKAPEV